MAKLITRRFEGTNVEVLVYDEDNKHTDELGLYVKAKDPKKIVREVKKILKEDYPEYRYIDITGTVEVSELRGIDEEEFYARSVSLDPVTRKPL